MQTRIGIVTADLSAEQAEALFANVQVVLSDILFLSENGYGSGNVRLETRTFEGDKRIDTRQNSRVDISPFDTEDDEDVEAAADGGFLGKIFGS